VTKLGHLWRQPIGGTVEALLTKVINWGWSVLLIVAFFVASATPLFA
jgi:hypothetical protein